FHQQPYRAVYRTLAGERPREDLDGNDRPRPRAAAGAPLAEPHPIGEAPLGDELFETAQDRHRVEPDRPLPAHERQHHDAALAGTYGDHEPPRSHRGVSEPRLAGPQPRDSLRPAPRRASVSASRAAAATGASAGACHRARRPARAVARITPLRNHRLPSTLPAQLASIGARSASPRATWRMLAARWRWPSLTRR